ncbi:hypothetical protein THARTR1_04425 [Trichoderma harzianum]|uniref:Mitochondrial distribution and morphology protein 12 n=1 Tax=Trichoderma harzianum TaxID=5544 RepID=A0A2K0UBZ2_TRIHA|nr:hypothetical protein THARTR1_04425 [Trichoderma harzianum]
MSIDLNWETLTTGPDGDALAESIRTFIHTKFQTVPLPRFIRSVNVHGFDFGTIPPELELKDITDPLPDFYEQELEDDEESDEDSEEDESAAERERMAAAAALMGARRRENGLGGLKSEMMGFSPSVNASGHDVGRAFLGTSTPGILGGPGRNYFQAHLATGTHTPLAAVAGAHLGTSWMGSTAPSSEPTPYHSREASLSSLDNLQVLDSTSGSGSGSGMAKSDVSSTLGPPSRPSTSHGPVGGSAVEDDDKADQGTASPRREPRVEDVQAVFRIRYSGDVRLNLTAEILLDYPMPSFVGIPLKLNITGLTFDGVGVLAHIRKRVHFCFLNPDDALAAVGPEGEGTTETSSATATTATGGGDLQTPGKKQSGGRFGGLLQEIKVESEIGERESGRQSLKNVGKVERFVLEQVRRIFEEEFVYPSFWTFLV